MPKNLLQQVVFTTLMVIVMVYGMICYNIALASGGLTNAVFSAALKELLFMAPIAFVLEFAIVGKLAKKLAFSFVDPRRDNPFMITLAISASIILIMCPIMSFIATALFNGFHSEFLASWVQIIALNFPMAFFFQIFFAGPLVRLCFRLLFPQKNAEPAASPAH